MSNHIYLVKCQLRHSKLVAYVLPVTASSKREAIQKIRRTSTIADIAIFSATREQAIQVAR